MGSASDPTSDLDQRIDRLVATASLGDAGELRSLLHEQPALTPGQAKRLYTVAVEQSTTADIRMAFDVGNRELFDQRDSWTVSANALGAFLEYGEDAKAVREGLILYWDTTRGEKALREMAPLVDRVEAALAQQRDILALHEDAASNSYPSRVAALATLMTTMGAPDLERHAAAVGLLTERDRYASFILPKLKPLVTDLEALMPLCATLSALVPQREPFTYVQRWVELTTQLIASQRAATSLIEVGLDQDRVTPNAIIEGRARTEAVDGKTRLVLDDASAKMHEQLTTRRGELLPLAADDRPMSEERDALAKQLRAQHEDDPAPLVIPGAHSSRVGRTHPATLETWFRVAQVCWWSASVVVFIVLYLAGAYVAAGVAGIGLLLAIRSTVLLIALDRATLFERPGSGMVDLDEFEAAYMQGRHGQSPASKAGFIDLRNRYGRRAPEADVRAFMDGQVSLTAADRRRFIEECSEESVPIEALRQRVTAAFSHVSPVQRQKVMRQAERWLLRLELKYGAEVPVATAAAEADGSHAPGTTAPDESAQIAQAAQATPEREPEE